MSVENAMVPIKTETSTDTSDAFIRVINPEPGLTSGQKALLVGAGAVGAIGVGCIGFTIYNNYKNRQMMYYNSAPYQQPQQFQQQPMGLVFANDPRYMTPNQVAQQIHNSNLPGAQPIPTPEEQLHAYYQQQIAGLMAQNQQLANSNNQLNAQAQQMDGIIKQQAAQAQQANAEINRLNSIIYSPQMQNPALNMPGVGMAPPQQ